MLIDSVSVLSGVDKQIYDFLDINDPKSFLLYAGAGSGKTRTLVNVLREVKNKDFERFGKSGKRVAVITYTNAACEEIKHRLNYDSAFYVSTIHSFVWDLIKPFNRDIKDWLRHRLSNDIVELDEKVARARDKNGVTAQRNAAKAKSKRQRLEDLENVFEFSYSPTTNRFGKDSLNHAEVLQIAADFVDEQPLMQKVLVNRFPILLIDESQDTNKHLLEAFINTQQSNKDVFVVGLFGDMMQRIYGGGKEDLEKALPSDWETPAKKVNYRCPNRVVDLINKIRIQSDKHMQDACDEAIDGTVRLFIADSECSNKAYIESEVRKVMSDLTGDDQWQGSTDVKCLTLEHAMAAQRGEFDEFFMPLSEVDKLRDAALNGTSKEVRFITDLLIPLMEAIESRDRFETARIIKSNSNEMSPRNETFIADPITVLMDLDSSVEQLEGILSNNETKLIDLINFVHENRLLIVPDKLLLQLSSEYSDSSIEEDNDVDREFAAWQSALASSLAQAQNYSRYLLEELGFATHQGVKGLQFERVMAILDDSESKGFLFKYEKLFGTEDLSATDIKNETEGRDSAQARARRLFYVICSRAEKSLAVIAYTKNPAALEANALKFGWFEKDEVVHLG